jgi:4-hydroxy-3-methylbut-2-enyl diphosphate reductase
MEVKTARKRGFCFGVERAIDLAAQVLRAGRTGTIYSLGEVIHNRQVVDRLAEQGLKVLERPEDAQVGDTVLIRSHGVPPQVIEQLRLRGAEVVDATCVLVKRAQKLVQELAAEGYQVVVIGDENHPEVQGVLGYAPGIICVDRPDQLDRLPKKGRLGIVRPSCSARWSAASPPWALPS